LNFILGAFMGSWTQWSNWQITHEALARFMDLPVWPLRSCFHKCTQNEIQLLELFAEDQLGVLCHIVYAVESVSSTQLVINAILLFCLLRTTCSPVLCLSLNQHLEILMLSWTWLSNVQWLTSLFFSFDCKPIYCNIHFVHIGQR